MDFEYEEMEMTEEWYMENYKRLIKESNIPPIYLKRPDIYVQEEDKEVYEYLDNLKHNMADFVKEGKNLLLYSKTVGCGKTMWSIELLKAYFWDSLHKNYITDGVFINVPNLLNLLKMGIDDIEYKVKAIELQKRLTNSKLVILDDIGVKDLSEYDKNLLYTWVDKRTSNLKSTIYTTNLTPDELVNCLDVRLADRVLGYSTVKEFKGLSFRGIEEC